MPPFGQFMYYSELLLPFSIDSGIGLDIENLSVNYNDDDDNSDNNFLRRYFNPIRIILDSSIRIFTGGEAESNELKNLFLNEEFEGWHDSLLIKNAKDILNKTSLSSETNRAIKALLVKTLGDKVAKKTVYLKDHQ